MDAPMPASKKLLVTLFCLYVLSALSNGVLSVALGDILAEFALRNTGQGLLNSSSQLGCLFSYLLIPLLQNRSGRAALLCAGVGLAGLMQALMGFSPGLWLFLFALFFCGLGQGFLDSGINSLVIGLSGEHGGRVVNLLHMCYSLGATLSPLLLTLLLGGLGWRKTYALSGLLLLAGLLAFLLALFLHRRKAGAAPLPKDKPASWTGFGRLLRDRANLCAMAACALYTAAQYSLVNWLVVYLSEELGQSDARAAFALSLLWAGIILSRFFTSRARGNSLRRLYLGFFLCAPAYMLCLWLGGYGAVCAAVFAFGLLCGHGIPTFLAWLGAHNPDHTLTIVAVCNLCTGVFGALWPMVVAALRGAYSLRSALLLSGLLLLFSGLFAYDVDRGSAHAPNRRERGDRVGF